MSWKKLLKNDRDSRKWLSELLNGIMNAEGVIKEHFPEHSKILEDIANDIDGLLDVMALPVDERRVDDVAERTYTKPDPHGRF
tara:strand:- start:870 stop:1118 length:249 start_codon:yes stop_codon:yes gene_type:complete